MEEEAENMRREWKNRTAEDVLHASPGVMLSPGAAVGF